MAKRTEHFNQLTEAEAERLAVFIEEAGEAIQAACKVLRHGWEATDKTPLDREKYGPINAVEYNNRADLEREIGHTLHSITLLQQHDINAGTSAHCALQKAAEIGNYLHHSEQRNPEQRKPSGKGAGK